ncbi:ATP-binding protein, partial [Anaerobacillus alkalilacustris]|uniref:ATP-binding protein n=1 Tax=Anaerobacillus alkalilacustris TaxID=393763 RepID=UPI000B0742A0
SMCYENSSIVITTNLQFGQWNHVFGDPILTEAVIDRLIHHSHLLVFKGDSHVFGDPILTEAVIDRLIHHSHLLVFKGDSFRYKESLLHQ